MADRLPQSSYDRLSAACQDILLWGFLDPDAYLGIETVPDEDYWEPYESNDALREAAARPRRSTQVDP